MNSLICLATIVAIANGQWIGNSLGGLNNPVYELPQNPEYVPLWSSNVIGQQNWVPPTIQDQGPIGSESNADIFRNQVLAHETTEEKQQKELQDFITKMEEFMVQPKPTSNEPLDPSKASQMAQEMLQQSHQAELAQLQESLQELQQPSPKSIWALPEVSKVQQVAHKKAVESLKEFVSHYQVGQLPEKQDIVTKLLNETLQVSIKGQMAIHNLQLQESVQVPSFLSTDQLVKNFTNDLQQLLAVNNLLHTQNALVEHQMEAKQIQVQQNFLKKQIQRLQVYQHLLLTQAAQVYQSLQNTQQEMYTLQQQLQTQQFAQQMLISRLQQVLISQRMGMKQLAIQQHVQAQGGIHGPFAENLSNVLYM